MTGSSMTGREPGELNEAELDGVAGGAGPAAKDELKKTATQLTEAAFEAFATATGTAKTSKGTVGAASVNSSGDTVGSTAFAKSGTKAPSPGDAEDASTAKGSKGSSKVELDEQLKKRVADLQKQVQQESDEAKKKLETKGGKISPPQDEDPQGKARKKELEFEDNAPKRKTSEPVLKTPTLPDAVPPKTQKSTGEDRADFEQKAKKMIEEALKTRQEALDKIKSEKAAPSDDPTKKQKTSDPAEKIEQVVDRLKQDLDKLGLPSKGTSQPEDDKRKQERDQLVQSLKANFASSGEDGTRTYYKTDPRKP